MSKSLSPFEQLANDSEYSKILLEGRLQVSYLTFRYLAHGRRVGKQSGIETIVVFPRNHEFVRSLAVLSTSRALEATVTPVQGAQHIFTYDRTTAKVGIEGGVPPSLMPELAYGFERAPKPEQNDLYRESTVGLIVMGQILDEASQLLQQKDMSRVSIIPVSTDTA